MTVSVPVGFKATVAATIMATTTATFMGIFYNWWGAGREGSVGGCWRGAVQKRHELGLGMGGKLCSLESIVHSASTEQGHADEDLALG